MQITLTPPKLHMDPKKIAMLKGGESSSRPHLGSKRVYRYIQFHQHWGWFLALRLPCLTHYKDTSSTAQGGGGSFKNRKPIGEVGCCESGMAKRIHWWIERCLISLTLSLSFSAYLPTYLLTYLPTYLSSIYLSIYRSLYLSLFFI